MADKKKNLNDRAQSQNDQVYGPRRPASWRIHDETLKRLRVWCAMAGVDQAGTVDTCIRMWLDHLASESGPDFRKAFEAAVEHTDLEPDAEG